MPAKKITIVLLCFFFSALSNAGYDEADLKKLFTDKAQRAQIDATRSGIVAAPGLRQMNKVNLSGYMTRSDGKSVVWLNNKNTLAGTKVDNVNVHQSSVGRNKKVTVSIDGESVHLKPGERWLKETGEVVDNK